LEEQQVPRMWVRAATAGLCLVLLAATVLLLRHERDWGLEAQQWAAAEIKARYGEDARVVSIGVPAALVLLRAPTPESLPAPGDESGAPASAPSPAGFQHWLGQVDAYKPDLVLVGNIASRHQELFHEWVRERYVFDQIGPWTVCRMR